MSRMPFPYHRNTPLPPKLTMTAKKHGTWWICNGFALFPGASRRTWTTCLGGRSQHQAKQAVRGDWKHRQRTGDWT